MEEGSGHRLDLAWGFVGWRIQKVVWKVLQDSHSEAGCGLSATSGQKERWGHGCWHKTERGLRQRVVPSEMRQLWWVVSECSFSWSGHWWQLRHECAFTRLPTSCAHFPLFTAGMWYFKTKPNPRWGSQGRERTTADKSKCLHDDRCHPKVACADENADRNLGPRRKLTHASNMNDNSENELTVPNTWELSHGRCASI